MPPTFTSLTSLGATGQPESSLAAERTLFTDQYFHIEWDLPQTWLAGSPTILLGALCRIDTSGLQRVLITENTEHLRMLCDPAPMSFERMCEIGDRLGVAVHSLSEPLPLGEVAVAKPWGQERWFTGIEARGVCDIGGTPLPWLLSFAPGAMGCGIAPAPILLKILEPFPDPVYGDLYFELHETKREVYVVTAIDERAWPQSIGAIRFGLNAERRASYDDDAAFKRAYLDAVNSYLEVRESIDLQLDQRRADSDMALDLPLSPETLSGWIAELPADLRRTEISRRATMDGFTSLRDVRVGDTIVVPPRFPHALQHGVNVVEFQSPHYERHILSFAQKVLTQNHWDTATALDLVELEPPDDRPVRLDDEWGVLIDLIAEFDSFHVHRVTLPKDGWLTLDYPTYTLIMGVSGSVGLGDSVIEPECARWIPACAASQTTVGLTNSVFLLAIPH